MSPVPVFRGHVNTRGKLIFDDRAGVLEHVRSLNGQAVDVVIKKAKDKRSLDQNAYWWAVPVKILAEHCGYTDAQMHYALLGECFGYTAGPTGQPVPVKPSSSDLSTQEFKHLIDWCLTWAPTELGVEIPEPSKAEAA